MDLSFSVETYRAVSEGGIPYKVRMPLKPGVRTVAVVVSDDDADRVGVAQRAVGAAR